jgi:hypothetical protein
MPPRGAGIGPCHPQSAVSGGGGGRKRQIPELVTIEMQDIEGEDREFVVTACIEGFL